MNKMITIGVASLLTLAPFIGQAADYSRFEGRYIGAWDDTYDSCGDTEQSGEIVINLKSIDTDGTILNATVKYNDDAKIHSTSGRVFKRNGVRRIRLNYGSDNDGTTYVIRAKLKNNRKIAGRYEHEYSSCAWGGTVKLSHD